MIAATASGLFGDDREHVAHEVDAAPLPTRLVQDLGDRLPQSLVSIGDHQAHTLQASLDEAPQERGPELVVLARSALSSEHRALALLGDPDRHDGGDRDHPAGLPDLVKRRIEPTWLLDLPPEEGPDLFVE
jgi:hypothetical protein